MAWLDRFRKKQPSRKPRGASGRGHTSGYLVHEEKNADLVGIRGLDKFDEMYRTDPDVRRIVWMVVNLVVGATWNVEPYGGDEAEEKDRECAEALEWALTDHMRPNLPSHLAQALPVGIRSGFAPFEQVWEHATWNGRDLLVPKTLGLRLPRTIYKWEQDGEELTSITQLLPAGGNVEIPTEDLVYYRFGAEGDNWEGTSLLRSVYKPWFFKDFLEKIAGIKAEREAVGVPIVYPPSGKVDDGVLDEVEEMLENLRSAEQAYMVSPGPKAEHLGPENAHQGWTFEILHQGSGGSSDGAKGELLALLEYQSDKIAAAFVAEFMRLGQGTQSVGARATADVQQDPFLAGVEAIASIVEAALQESVVERFVALNFEVDEPPKLRMSLVDSTSLEELATFVKTLIDGKALTPDAPLEDFLRERGDLPPADPEERERQEEMREAGRQAVLNPPEPAADPANPAPGGKPPSNQPPAPTPTKLPKAPTPAKSDKPDIPDKSDVVVHRLDREMRWWERVMALDTIESSINGARERFESAGGPPTRAMVRELVAAALKGRDPKLAPPKELTMALGEELAHLYDTGRTTVRLELAVQSKGAPAPTVDDLDDARELARRAKLAAQSIVQRTWQAINRQVLAQPDNEAEAQKAGEAEAMAGLRAEAQLHASAALNSGRQDEAEAHSEEIAGARYTSILDANRCDNCRAADDDVLRQLDDPVRLSHRPPNALCHGGGRCRCLEFYELKDEASGFPGFGSGPPGPATAVAQRFPVSVFNDEQGQLVVDQLDAIAGVHEIPEDHPTVPIEVTTELKAGVLGRWSYYYDPVTGEILDEEIKLSASALRRRPPLNSTVHEIGHSLDSHGFGAGLDGALLLQDNLYSSTPAMDEWRRAVEASKAYAQLQAVGDAYLLDVKELFARSYEQWIATRSGNRQLLSKIAARNAEAPGSYWADEDFTPIGSELDRFFEARGLRSS